MLYLPVDEWNIPIRVEVCMPVVRASGATKCKYDSRLACVVMYLRFCTAPLPTLTD